MVLNPWRLASPESILQGHPSKVSLFNLMHEQNLDATDLSRRRFLKSTAAGLAAVSAVGFGVSKGQATEGSSAGSDTVPELAPQWKKLDLAEILSRPAAFVSTDSEQDHRGDHDSWPPCRLAIDQQITKSTARAHDLRGDHEHPAQSKPLSKPDQVSRQARRKKNPPH
jgi:hypothetical protein